MTRENFYGTFISDDQAAYIFENYLNKTLDNDTICSLTTLITNMVGENIAHNLALKATGEENPELARIAQSIIGKDAYIKFKVENELHLFSSERDYVLEHFSNEEIIAKL